MVEWASGTILSIRKGFDRATGSENLPGIGPHTLRHTAAVHIAKGEGPMSQIAQYLGHSSTAITERTYARYSPDHLQTAAEMLDFGKLRKVQ